MYDLIFYQTAELAIQHSIKLRYKEHIITILSMLGEELQPFLPSPDIPFAGIKYKLGLVDEQPKLTLTEFVVLKIGGAILF